MQTAFSTPHTGHTFGNPGFSPVPIQFIKPPPSPTVEREKRRRRLRRYSDAENALRASTINHLSETSTTELQIRILRQAVSVLNAYAEEARENSARLHTLLLDGQVHPADYESIKRQRWLEEKRQLTASHESKVLHDKLQLLISTLDPISIRPLSDAERRQTNLVNFLVSSTTRRPLQIRLPHTRRSHHFTVSELAKNSRLRLPQSIIDYLENLGRSQLSRNRIRESVAMTFGVQPGEVSEPPESVSSSPITPTTSFGFSPITETPLTALDPVICSPEFHLSNSPESSPVSDGLQGKATIYNRYGLVRGKDEILADMSHVSLPRYAKDLIHNFEEEPFNVSPRLRPMPRRPSDGSDWEVLSASYQPLDAEVLDLPSPSRKGHKPAASIDRPLPPLPESPTKSKPSFLRKRPSHRPFLSLVAIPESSSSSHSLEGGGDPSSSDRTIQSKKGSGLKRNLSFGIFHSQREANTLVAPDSQRTVHPMTPPGRVTEANDSVQHSVLQPTDKQPRRKLRRKLSLGLLTLDPIPAPSEPADFPNVSSGSDITAKADRRLSLKERVKKKFNLYRG